MKKNEKLKTMRNNGKKIKKMRGDERKWWKKKIMEMRDGEEEKMKEK